ncbi:MAG TPA: ceramidase domain-containing protein [Cytophagaceae bacterium]|jgi:hypothetical protein
MQKKHSIIFYSLTVVAVAALFIVGPVHQDCAYHNFADSRTVLGIPNFFNVISNLPFVLIGFWGLYKLYGSSSNLFLKIAYFIFCLGIIFTGVGSAYYHWAPSSESLVWDRLPMTIAFMSFFSIMISPYFGKKREYLVLIVLLVSGFLSVFYWYLGDSGGEGDLRPYIFVQYYPLVIVIISLLMLPSSLFPKRLLAIAFFFYMLAKVFEITDYQLYDLSNYISGHTLKHLAAGVASLAIVATYDKVKPSSGFD